MLQIILISIAALFGSIVLAGLLMQKEYTLSAEIIINQPKEKVFDFVKMIRNQEKYSKWVMADPDVKLVYAGIDGTVGFKAAWSSGDKNVGVGEQEIMKMVDGEQYFAEIRFEKPFKGVSQANTKVTAISANSSKVVTTFESKTPFPMNLFLPMIKKMLTKDMSQNAENLKRVLEAQG